MITTMEAPGVRTIDVALAAVGAAALVVVMSRVDGAGDTRSFDLLAGLLVVVAAGVLALHRRAPMTVLAVTTAALALYSLRDYPGGPVYLTWIGAVFAVSVARGPAKAWAPAVVSTAVVVGTAFHGQRTVGEKLDLTTVVAVLFVSWAAGALLLGGSVRGLRAERAALEERARHLAETREEEARRRVVEERLRIARDLHDSVAHGLASIAVQAGVGAHVLDERPEDARAALLAVKRASGAALAELRATLGMLRSDDAAASREPAAGLDLLPRLVEGARAAGLAVDVEVQVGDELAVDGEVRPLRPAVDAAAFRIVQESLTNVIRHAGAARATVALRHTASGLDIEVTDDGRGAAPAGNGDGRAGNGDRGNGDGHRGHGLAGMRERVALLGGEMDAGPRRSGGYQVRARLPR
jgi:signal transduction histidine kinase